LNDDVVVDATPIGPRTGAIPVFQAGIRSEGVTRFLPSSTPFRGATR
jgi:hypothetical protein